MWLFSTNPLPSFFPATKFYGPVFFYKVDDGPPTYRRILKSTWAGRMRSWFLAGCREYGLASWTLRGHAATSSNSSARPHSSQHVQMGLFQISKHAWAVHPRLSPACVGKPWERTSTFLTAMVHDPHLSAGPQPICLRLSAIWKEVRNLTSSGIKWESPPAQKPAPGHWRWGSFKSFSFWKMNFFFHQKHITHLLSYELDS